MRSQTTYARQAGRIAGGGLRCCPIQRGPARNRGATARFGFCPYDVDAFTFVPYFRDGPLDLFWPFEVDHRRRPLPPLGMDHGRPPLSSYSQRQSRPRHHGGSHLHGPTIFAISPELPQCLLEPEFGPSDSCASAACCGQAHPTVASDAPEEGLAPADAGSMIGISRSQDWLEKLLATIDGLQGLDDHLVRVKSRMAFWLDFRSRGCREKAGSCIQEAADGRLHQGSQRSRVRGRSDRRGTSMLDPAGAFSRLSLPTKGFAFVIATSGTASAVSSGIPTPAVAPLPYAGSASARTAL